MGVFPAASGKFLPLTWRTLMSADVSGCGFGNVIADMKICMGVFVCFSLCFFLLLLFYLFLLMHTSI